VLFIFLLEIADEILCKMVNDENNNSKKRKKELICEKKSLIDETTSSAITKIPLSVIQKTPSTVSSLSGYS